MTHSCTQTSTVVCSAFKMWHKHSKFEDTDSLTDYSVLFLSSAIFHNYAITIKTHSHHNQTSVTKE